MLFDGDGDYPKFSLKLHLLFEKFMQKYGSGPALCSLFEYSFSLKVACRIPSREKHWKEGWASDKPIRGGICHNSNLAGRCRTLFLEQVQCIGHCTKLFILCHSFHPLGKGCVFPILEIRWLRFYSINRFNTPKLETTELGFRQRLVRLHAEVS